MPRCDAHLQRPPPAVDPPRLETPALCLGLRRHATDLHRAQRHHPDRGLAACQLAGGLQVVLHDAGQRGQGGAHLGHVWHLHLAERPGHVTGLTRPHLHDQGLGRAGQGHGAGRVIRSAREQGLQTRGLGRAHLAPVQGGRAGGQGDQGAQTDEPADARTAPACTRRARAPNRHLADHQAAGRDSNCPNSLCMASKSGSPT